MFQNFSGMLRRLEFRKGKIHIFGDFNIYLINKGYYSSREYSDIVKGYKLRIAVEKLTCYNKYI